MNYLGVKKLNDKKTLPIKTVTINREKNSKNNMW